MGPGMTYLRSLVLAAVVPAMAWGAWAQAVQAQTPPQPTCTTFNASNEPSSSFDAGERIIVRGTGFGAGSLVFIRFEQGPRTAELARAEANDLGAFTAPAADVPADVDGGSASIQALDARGSATCSITVSEAAVEEEGWNVFMTIWVAGLVLGAIVLAVLSYRRWKSERLKEAMDRIGGREPADDARSVVAAADDRRASVSETDGPGRTSRRRGGLRTDRTSWELDPWEQEAASAPAPRGSASDRRPATVDLDDDEDWLAAEDDVDAEQVVLEQEREVTFPIGPGSDAAPEVDADDNLEDDAEESVEESDDESWAPPEPQRRPAPARRTTARDAEPTRLPVGWDEGRLRPTRQTSDAIERLRREVKTWGRS